jgi:diguanylate cyclase (GGDEF)-like protein
VHTLLAKQIIKATAADGRIDIDKLVALVSEAYEETDRDRRRTDHSIATMTDELQALNRHLEQLVKDRTIELREREGELKAKNLLFEAATNNMSQGLLMFNAEGRLVICNKRYLEMYNLSPEQARPGATVRDLLDLRIANGTFVGDPEEYQATMWQSLAQGKTVSQILEVPDGRIIAMQRRPMDNGGWVVTHEDITERRRAEQQIEHMAHHDALTDLPNRTLLRHRLAEAISKLSAGRRAAVLYLDLDHFKTVNDTLGHPIGDELLCAVADRLRNCVRENDLVARVSGDEFAIIQTGIAQADDTVQLARRIRETLRVPHELQGHVVITDCSIGIAVTPDDGTEPDVLMKNADMGLYRAKDDGRGTYRFFEPGMDTRMQARRRLELDLRNAMTNQEFEIHYQPIVDLRTNTITAFEALLRWRHPERGMISPAEFIPVAEEIGLIVAIGDWVIRRACIDAASWPSNVRIAVNLSPTQLANPNIVQTIVSAFSTARLRPERLEVEITEAVLMQNTDTMLATLHQLRALGLRISMDDFGTGYSSLSYLRSFPFDKIKIDRCFIKGLENGAESAAIVQAVAQLARSLNMTTTAEGVETSQQLKLVRSLGCTEMQGYLFSRPVPIEEASRLLEERGLLKRGAA